MTKSSIQSFLRALGRLVLRLLTSTYIGAYRYHTLDPIEKIRDHQDGKSRESLVKALADFRRLKHEELAFVAKAAALSAAAVIGIFSWAATEKTVWAAKMLWNWSFFLSTFSMIGSAPTRVLQHLPKKDQAHCSEDDIKCALNLFLQPLSAESTKHREISWRMLWAWQCPAMLMSYSWVLFLVGYTLHILTPIFDESQAQTSYKVAVVTVCGCGLIVLNFIFCATMCQYRLQDKPLSSWIPVLFGGTKNKDDEAKSKDNEESQV